MGALALALVQFPSIGIFLEKPLTRKLVTYVRYVAKMAKTKAIDITLSVTRYGHIMTQLELKN